MLTRLKWFLSAAGLFAGLLLLRPATKPALAADKKDPPKIAEGAASGDSEWQVPRERWKLPFKDEQPIYFVNRSQAAAEWDKLPSFWNETTENAVDPMTGEKVMRKAVKIKVPLGLTVNPPVPVENPMTVAKWKLGKHLYFSPSLSSDATVSCATCHDPKLGFTDRAPVSTGIRGNKGGMSAPTVYNSAYNALQFWDGRAASLEDQAQGPVMNPLEMFDGDGHAWNHAVSRIRRNEKIVQQFREVFGTDPTRDGIAKAIAAYERTVLSGNAIHDRADVAMRARVEDEGSGKYDFKAKDYESVLLAAFDAKDKTALDALGLDGDKDRAKAAATAKSIHNGRALFFGKARCNGCHIGDNFTDNQFHNLGVGVKDGQLPPNAWGRFASLPTGHKNAEAIGAFKTPTLRHLTGTAPYMHDGNEKTLEEVVDFYDRGGNANEFLDTKMRDTDAERAYLLSQRNHTPYKGAEIKVFGKDEKPIAPLKLNLTPQEKHDLTLFLRALQGDSADPVVMRKE